MTLISTTKKKEQNKQTFSILSTLSGIEKKSPEEAHKTISLIIYDQHKKIQQLINDNRELWMQIQKYKQESELRLEENQHGTSQTIIKRIWDNKEDEFWNTL